MKRPFVIDNGMISFEVSELVDHEIAVLERVLLPANLRIGTEVR